MKRPNYGIDAPKVVRTFFVIGIAGLAVAAILKFAMDKGFVRWAGFITSSSLWIGGIFLAQGIVMLWGSRWGKLGLRDKAIESIPWRGDELVLDVGCGHGLMLIAAAKKLRTGRAIGIDIWQQEDQADNSREGTWQNVQLENVADRVELQDGDARKLPFADDHFDVIVSSWALHNIYDAAGRAIALREIARVLKPGGRLVIIDIRHTAEYAVVLGECGMAEKKRAGPNFLFVIPTFTLTATKR